MINWTSSEFKKTRRTGLWYVTVLIPLLVTILIFISFILKRSFYENGDNYSWNWYTKGIFALWGIFILPMHISLVSTSLVNIDKRTIKSIVIREGFRKNYYIAKTITAMLIVITSNALLVLYMTVLGSVLNLQGPLVLSSYITKAVINGTMAIMPLTSMMILISMITRNTSYVIGIGAVSSLLSLMAFSDEFGRFLPGSYLPAVLGANKIDVEPWYLTAALLTSIFISLLGYLYVKKSEIY